MNNRLGEVRDRVQPLNGGHSTPQSRLSQKCEGQLYFIYTSFSLTAAKSGSLCFRSASEAKKRERLSAPKACKSLKHLEDLGAGEGIRTLDPNLGKVALSSVIQRDRLCRIARASCLRGPLRGSEDRWTSRVSAV